MRRFLSHLFHSSLIAALATAGLPVSEAHAQDADKAATIRAEMAGQRTRSAPKTIELERALETNDDEKALDSYATMLVSHIWKEPKARYLVSGIVIGEVFLAGMLWKRMALNRAVWENQTRTVGRIAKGMAPAAASYARAESDLLRAFAALEEADRIALTQSLNQFGPHTKNLLQQALQPARPVPPPVGALDLDTATRNLEKAYAGWQQKAVAQVPVLEAAGTGLAKVQTPQALSEIVATVDQRVRALTRLDYANGQFRAFKESGLQQLANQARVGLGRGLSWKGKVWRKARTGLLLAAIPLFAVGISAYYDAEHERNQRLQDSNKASLQDRNKWLNTLVPYFHRPLLFAVVRAWNTVQARAHSPLKRFNCPYETRPAALDNPHLQIIQALSMATLLEMEQANEDVLEENGRKTIVISPRFFRRLFQKIVDSEGSALKHLTPETLNPILEDLADEAFHAFDNAEAITNGEDAKNSGASLGFRD